MSTEKSDHLSRPLHTSIEHMAVEFVGIKVALRVKSQESNGACAVFETTVAPYFSELGPHVHRKTTAVFYIIQGSLAFTVGEETLIARQGRIIHIAPGLVHRFWNPTAMPATCLVFLSPGGFEQYFVELSTLLADSPLGPFSNASRIESLGLAHDYFPA